MNRLRHPAAGFLLILLIAALLRFLYLNDFAALPLCGQVCGPDVSEYYEQAQLIRAGQWLPDSVPIHAPLYSYWLALLLILSGGEIFLTRLIQSLLLAVLMQLPVFLMLRRRTAGLSVPMRFLPYAAALLIGIYPPLVICQCEFFSENLMMVLLLFSLWSFSLHRKTADGLAGVFAGLAALAHPGCIFYLPAAAGYAFFRIGQTDRRAGLLRAGSFLMGAALMIAPVSLRHSLLARRPILIQDNSMFNLVLGNAPESTGTCRLPPGSRWDEAQERARREAEKRGVSVDHYYREEFFRYLVTRPGHYLRMLLKKGAMALNEREFTTWSDAISLNLIFWHRWLYQGWFLVMLLLGGPVLIAGVFKRHCRRFLGPELVLFAAIFAGQVFFLTAGRYRLPLILPLAVFAGYFCCGPKRFLGTPRTMVLTLGFMIGLYLVGSYPFAISRQPERDYARSLLASALLQAGRPAEAVKIYESPTAGEIFPDRRLNILGQAWHELGDLNRAERCYREFMHRYPQQPTGYLNYAAVLADLGRFPEAEAALNAGLKLHPTGRVRADMQYNLGEIAQRSRNYVPAEKYYLEALRTLPSHRKALNNLGTVYLLRREPAKAAVQFERALRQTPDDVRVMVNLAVSLALCGRKAEAAELAEKALRRDPACVQSERLLQTLRQ